MKNPYNNIFIGIDPGKRNCAISGTWIEDYLFEDRYIQYDNSKHNCMMDFADDVACSNYAVINEFTREGLIDPDRIVIVIERQFDRSPGKPLERLQHVLEYSIYRNLLPSISLLLIAPTQLKKWLTNNGKADESEYWMQVQRVTDKLPMINNPETTNQHIIEARLMALMGYDWYARQHSEDYEPLKIGYKPVLDKVQDEYAGL